MAKPPRSRSRVRVDRGADQPIHEQARRYILHDVIRGGGLSAGDAIPSANVIARRLSINHLTVRRAVSDLVRQGVLVTRPCRGAFVAEGGLDRRVLWLCGQHVARNDVSPYYTILMRICEQAARQHGLTLEPVWLAGHETSRVESYLRPERLNRYAGFLFVSCDGGHPVFDRVRQTDRPYVQLTSRQAGPRRVTNDVEQFYRLGLDCLRGRGHRHALVMTAHHETAICEPIAEELGLSCQYILWDRFGSATMAERKGYRLMQSVLAQQGYPPALFLRDDMVARGVTRAILADGSLARGGCDVVVVSGLQQITPLGMPVRYVVTDVHEEARMAVELLVHQLERTDPLPDEVVVPVRLVDESVFDDLDMFNHQHVGFAGETITEADGMA